MMSSLGLDIICVGFSDGCVEVEGLIVSCSGPMRNIKVLPVKDYKEII